MTDTIFAVSSGAPPAAIGVIRVSGPNAFAAGTRLAGTLPPPRRAGVRRLRDASGGTLDQALVLVFPGPATATGEDLVEFHVHGGRAVIRAVLAALAAEPGLRPAEPGEFTRRALTNGRIDLAQAEGLADLLAAEGEAARRAALSAAEGKVSRKVAAWGARLVALSARLEAQIDFADEDDVPADPVALVALRQEIDALAVELRSAAATPPTERLRDGIRVVLAGPPNSGKSSLLNALAERDVAIATPIAGTTRDRLEAPVLRGGTAWLLIDVAGLRDAADDAVEAIGIARARAAIDSADIVVWLGDDDPPDPQMLAVHARCDLPERAGVDSGRLAVSTVTGEGLATLWNVLETRGADLVPRVDQVAFNRRQLECLSTASAELRPVSDPVLMAEHLRAARRSLDGITGTADIERLLDDVFGRFCIGK